MADSAAHRKIFIGGLSYGTDDEKLKKYFGTYGQVQDAVVMKDPVSRRSRGFGFITFCDIDSVDNALAHEPHTIDARKVEAKRAVPRSEGKETPAVAVSVAPAKNSSSETTNSKTKTTSTNSTNNSSSSSASPAVASAKVSNSNSNSSSTNKTTASTGTTISSSAAAAATTTINQSTVANQQPTSTTQAMIQDVSRHATDPRINMDEYAYNKVFVGGLHYDTRDAEFRSYFEKYGKVLTAEVMFNRETHKSRGFGFIVFELEEGAEGVCAEKEHIIDGKVVEVKRAIPRNKLPTATGTNGTVTTTAGAAGGKAAIATTAGKGVANTSKSGDIKRSASAGNVPASKNTTSTPKAASTTKTKGTTVTRSPATSYAAALKAGVGNEESQLDQALVDEDLSRPPRSHSEPIVPLPASLSFDFIQAQAQNVSTDLADISRNSSLSFDQTQRRGGPLLPPVTQAPAQFSSSGGLGSNSTDSMMTLGTNSNPSPNAWMSAPPPSVLGNSVPPRNSQSTEGSAQNNTLGSTLGWLSSPLSGPIGAPTNIDQGIHNQGSLDSFQQLPMTHIEVNNGHTPGYNNDMQYHQQQQQYQYQQQSVRGGLNPFNQQMQYNGGRMQQANVRYNPSYQNDWMNHNGNPENMLDQYGMQQGIIIITITLLLL